jgi:hypothetical protein
MNAPAVRATPSAVLRGGQPVDANSLARSRALGHAQSFPNNTGDATADVVAASMTLDSFKLRCWARAYLVEHAMMFLQEAVDGLQEAAFSTGLVDLLGQDEVQLTMGKAFEPRRGRTC